MGCKWESSTPAAVARTKLPSQFHHRGRSPTSPLLAGWVGVPGDPRGNAVKPDTGYPLHTHEPVAVASFRTWRGWRDCVARDRCPTGVILSSPPAGLGARALPRIGCVPELALQPTLKAARSGDSRLKPRPFKELFMKQARTGWAFLFSRNSEKCSGDGVSEFQRGNWRGIGIPGG